MLTFAFSEDLSAKLAAARDRAVDFTPVMAAIADKMRTEVALRFETETGPDGKRWKPSARALAEGGLTLTDRGHLRQSIVAEHSAGEALAGTNLIYAAIHQFGGKISARPKSAGGAGALRTPFGPRGSVTMPARPFLGFSAEETADYEKMLADHVFAGLEGAA